MMKFVFWLIAAATGSIEVLDGQVYSLVGREGRATSKQNVFDAIATESINSKWFTIKYMHNCLFDSEKRFSKKTPHPVTNEIEQLTFFEQTGLVEKLVGYGDVENFEKSQKVNFLGWEDADYLGCKQAGAQVKFIIVNMTGGSVAPAQKNSNTIFQLMKFGIQLIKHIRTLHYLGKIHGNVGLESVQFKHPFHTKLGVSKIVMVNFEKSRAFGPYEGTTPKVNNFFSADEIPFLSPWELQNYRPSRRDDVYRAIELVAELWFEKRPSQLFRYLELNKVVSSKLAGIIYEGVLSAYSYFDDLKEPNRPKVEKILTDMTEKVLKLEIDEKPNYNAIISAFNAVIGLTKRGRDLSSLLGF